MRKSYTVLLVEEIRYTRTLCVPAEDIEDAIEFAKRMGLDVKVGLPTKSTIYAYGLTTGEDLPEKVRPEEGQSSLDNKYKDKMKPSTDVHDD